MAKKKEKPLIPISKKAAKIVGKMAECRIVEDLILNVTHTSSLDADRGDLAQIIYLALMQTDDSKLEQLETSGEMNFYIVRMIRNQFFSKNSPFYYEIRRFGNRSNEISSQISESYDADKDPLDII